jgi:cellulose synthase/poly-beta-1,6-N-acetylglucosamine synthase-like glycosyltransferase
VYGFLKPGCKKTFPLGIKAYLCASNFHWPLQIIIVILLTAVCVQLLYLCLFIIAFIRGRSVDAAATPPVSVVVCAHDEAENLKELVPMLLEQDYPEFEVIVVNDRSNDSTFDYLLHETEKHPRLRMVNVKSTPERVNGKKYGITLGIRAASHEWIVLTDADCRPRSNRWIRAMSAHFREGTSFVLGFSPYLRKSGLLNLFLRFETLLTALQYFSFGWMKNPYMGVGRNLAYRKSLFLEEKGFNNFLHVTGGDDDLFVNIHARGRNTRLEISADSQVFSEPKTTWSSFYEQKIRHLSVGKRYRFSHRLLLGLFSASWIFTWLVSVVALVWILAARGMSAFVEPEIYLVLVPFALRWIVLLLLFKVMLSKASLGFALWTLPVLDFIYAIYYLSTGLMALTTKKIRWRN